MKHEEDQGLSEQRKLLEYSLREVLVNTMQVCGTESWGETWAQSRFEAQSVQYANIKNISKSNFFIYYSFA